MVDLERQELKNLMTAVEEAFHGDLSAGFGYTNFFQDPTQEAQYNVPDHVLIIWSEDGFGGSICSKSFRAFIPAYQKLREFYVKHIGKEPLEVRDEYASFIR